MTILDRDLDHANDVDPVGLRPREDYGHSSLTAVQEVELARGAGEARSGQLKRAGVLPREKGVGVVGDVEVVGGVGDVRGVRSS